MIKKVEDTSVHFYDHGPLVKAALSEPTSWFADYDEPNFPHISQTQIRRGAMKDYRPAGAFTARTRGGFAQVSFVGVPLEPWDHRSGVPFNDVQRTLDPDKCPPGTPERVVKALRKYHKRRAKAHEKRKRKAGSL